VNEKRIEEVIDIEKQADEIFNKAVSEAQQIPQQAEKEAKEMIENARLEAEKEAQKILASADAKSECEGIISEAESKIDHNQALSKLNFDRAVTYVISRVLGQDH
jgi:vacuolar-type H+-ATPase subunit H